MKVCEGKVIVQGKTWKTVVNAFGNKSLMDRVGIEMKNIYTKQSISFFRDTSEMGSGKWNVHDSCLINDDVNPAILFKAAFEALALDPLKYFPEVKGKGF